MAQRFGWPMLIFRNLDALEAQLRQTLSLWRQRVAAEHLREHLRRGRISALQGIRFLEALEDVGEGVLPGSLEEAEAFLNLPLGARWTAVRPRMDSQIQPRRSVCDRHLPLKTRLLLTQWIPGSSHVYKEPGILGLWV